MPRNTAGPARTSKRTVFVDAYLECFNATVAGRKVGLTRQAAASLLKEPETRELLATKTRQRAELAQVDATRVIQELARLGFSNVQDAFDEDGNLIPIKHWPLHLAAAVASVKVVMKNATAGDNQVDRILEIKLWQKPDALQTLARHFGLLVDRLDVTLGADAELLALLQAGRQRVHSLKHRRPQPLTLDAQPADPPAVDRQQTDTLRPSAPTTASENDIDRQEIDAAAPGAQAEPRPAGDGRRRAPPSARRRLLDSLD